MERKPLINHLQQKKLQRFLEQHKEYRWKHKNLLLCGSSGYTTHPIAIYSNGKSVKATGTMTCRNSWACPVCAVFIASKHARRITAIIERAKELGYKPFMLTLTIPHRFYQKPKEVLMTLKRCCKLFFSNMFRLNKITRATKSLCKVNNIECNYSKNGYHFHSHALIFVSEDTWQNLEQCRISWIEAWKNITERNSPFKVYDEADVNYMQRVAEQDYGCYISRDAQGNIREIPDGTYITAEMTTSYSKDTHTEHSRNIWDLLNTDNEEDYKIFLAYAEATRYIQKYNYSRNMAKRLQLTPEEFKKKCLPKQSDYQLYKLVCIFEKQSWAKMWCSDHFDHTTYIVDIFFYALHYRLDLILEYCETHNLDPPRQPYEWEVERFENFGK